MRDLRQLFFSYAIAILIAFSPLVPAAQAAQSSSPEAARLSDIAIDNFGRIDDHYYRGEQPEGGDYEALAALGIKTVIDLQADGDNADEARMVEAAGMTFVRIPMTTHVPPTQEQLARFLQIVNDPARRPVYVHCKGGRHRTGVLTAVYRMERNGWSADKAFDEMKDYDFGWDFLHREFKQFVYGYQPGRVVVAVPAGEGASK